ncbi:uncharacterized protein LOC126842397 [Adelges cooleyi]|uniref:uncharacterized protein LOC126842397 n=1 Tax=Adelges cooleyi TaxID=133065 RepID=UPI00217FA550|nr:uncharacterized protein LOC126842397 [Adelges cooleyi]
MKLPCILITFAFINISPIMTSNYANSVYITNKYIKEVSDTDPIGVEIAITFLLNGDKTVETISLMLAVPEKANFRLRIDHDDPFIMNLPEQIAIADQVAVQEAISYFTNIPVPQRDPNENFANDMLGTFGEQRRAITGKLTKNLLVDEISFGTPEFPNISKICRLIALVRSIRFPDAYIKTADVDHSEKYCKLTSRNDSFIYKPLMGNIVAVRPRFLVIQPNVIELVNVLNEIQFWF